VRRPIRWLRWLPIGIVAVMLSEGTASAQITPAAGYTPPDDTPSIRVGTTLFADYSYTTSPETTDTDGNSINNSAFNVTRAYVNITGNISHLVAFRVTPDVSRETGPGSSLNGSLTFRIKYAYAQINLDEWVPRSYTRLGVQQTPYLDYAEGIYRYRFQGTMFVEREGYFASADAGASFHHNLASNVGDVHVGYFNGENYNKAEVNDQKAVMIRGTMRPFARMTPVLRGLRLTGFYDGDHYIKDGDRRRALFLGTFEHAWLNAGVEYLGARDRTSITKDRIDSHGYSIWATPRTPVGVEALIRHDHLVPNDGFETQTQARNRTIVGVAYWFPHQGTVSSALMVDYDGQTFRNFSPSAASQKRVALHALVNF
jgi:hypothetical protein